LFPTVAEVSRGLTPIFANRTFASFFCKLVKRRAVKKVGMCSTETHEILREDSRSSGFCVLVPPLLWLLSDEASAVNGKRFIAADWDTALPAAQAAEKAGAPIAWLSIARMPIEPS
jgi:hypothetical protein